MARLVEADIATACQLEEMKQMATRDELTDLLNRRGFNLAAAQKNLKIRVITTNLSRCFTSISTTLNRLMIITVMM
ncbi:hypothetical protein QW180_28090 [Vibrio sinaloensis]|nr:hypothetical protein [Vibrio sinaloensis]